MAEAASAKPATEVGDVARGLPYYEKLKGDLRETIAKKKVLDKNIVRPLPSYAVIQRRRPL